MEEMSGGARWMGVGRSSAADARGAGAGAAVASAIEGVPDRPNKVLMLLTDGYTRSQENILRGVYGVVGAGVPLFGGAAAGRDGRTFQLHGSQVLGNGVVAAAIASDGPLGIGVSHGFQTVGDALVGTRSDPARVYTLDPEPAPAKYRPTA